MAKMSRNTVQRQIILEVVKNMDPHPTVEEVYLQIHKSHPTISKATIYRNLRLLAKHGAIRQVLLPDEADRFDKLTSQHYHFRCKICGTISDVDVEYLAGIDEVVRQKYGLRVDAHEVVFKGICKKCNVI